ncbi:hypothetical protein FPZ12_033215 [Amycolatopsis acidicola]|uniref:Uncharacterized protein n=1 Tax=Amycolatopsis acidicola TaxID=2596893 RepID=A0A5N0UUL6_9PSEU|nr:hypothetical protein [Amycolatopsis acidicola]KAA9153985.1 hypothetical protein FPZ12_033215 [Amycolatopsis acidicola]
MISVALVCGAAVLAAVAWWGNRNLEVLSEDGRYHRTAVLRRGVYGCYAIAAVFLVVAVVRLL